MGTKILSTKQLGLMNEMGNIVLLNYITSIIYEKLHKSIPNALTFLDLAKVFDTFNKTKY